MSQRRTVPRDSPGHSPEGGGSDRVYSFSLFKWRNLWDAGFRQWLACFSATLTMLVVGTVYGWTTISLPYLISGTGGVPLTLTPDESSWMVSLTVLGSMFGSLLAAQLADRIGRKDCLLLSSTICTIGWITIYEATSVPMLYIARVFLGIGVGIARTINPMFVSEVADISIRATQATMIALNVYVGAVLTCSLGIWLRYKYLLLVLILISFTSIWPNMCSPETPYFLVAKGQNKQALKSIAYYKDIADPERVKIELRDLRAQTRYELHPKSRYELHQQSSSLLPSQSRSDLPSQSRRDLPRQTSSVLPSQHRSDLPSQSRRDLTRQSSSVLPSQPRRDLPSQSRRDLTPQFSSDLPSQRRSDLPSQSRRDLTRQSSSLLPSQRRSDLPSQSRRDLPRQTSSVLPSQPRSDLPSQSRRDLTPQSSSDLPSQPRSDLPSQSRQDLTPQSSSDLHSQPRSDLPSQSRRDLTPQSSSDLTSQSRSDLHSQSRRDLTPQFSSDLPSQPRSDLPSQSRRDLTPQSSSDLPSQSTSDLPSQSRRDLTSQSSSDLPSQSRSDLPSQSRRDLNPQSSSDLPSQPRSDLPSQSRRDLTRQSSSDLPSQREAHSDSFWEVVDTGPMSSPSSTDSPSQPTSVIHTEVICDVLQQPTGELHRPSASEIHRPSTSEINQPSTNEINPDEICEIQSRSSSDLRMQSNVDKSSDLQSSVDARESSDIDEIYMDGTKYTCKIKLQAILHQSNRKALFIMLGMIMAQQLSGNFITMQYLEVLLNKTTTVIDPQEASLLVQFFGLVSGTLTIITVELIGRRTFLLISTAGSCLTLNILAIYLLLFEHQCNISNVSIFPVIDLIIYQIVFQLGLGTLSNVLLCDLFPTELKGFVGAIIVIFDGIIGFIVSKLYQVITDNVGSYAIYFIFTTSCFLAYIVVFLWIPETRDKTYREIEALLVGKNLNFLNERVRTNKTDIRRL